MQDEPTPPEILATVARFLREAVVPATQGALSFNARVAANAVDLVIRQIEQAPASDAAETLRLAGLLGTDATGDLDTDNALLAERIRDRVIAADAPALVDHLRRTVFEKMAVDQPRYETYRRAIARAATE